MADSWFQRAFSEPKPKAVSKTDQNKKVAAQLFGGQKVIVRYGDVMHLANILPKGEHIVCYGTFESNAAPVSTVVDRLIQSIEPPGSDVLQSTKRDWR